MFVKTQKSVVLLCLVLGCRNSSLPSTFFVLSYASFGKNTECQSQNICLGVGLLFRLKKKKACFQIWLTLIGQFNNVLVAYMNILLSFFILQKLWLEK